MQLFFPSLLMAWEGAVFSYPPLGVERIDRDEVCSLSWLAGPSESAVLQGQSTSVG